MRPINILPESMPHHISSGLSLLVKERTQNHSPTAPDMMGMIGMRTTFAGAGRSATLAEIQELGPSRVG